MHSSKQDKDSDVTDNHSRVLISRQCRLGMSDAPRGRISVGVLIKCSERLHVLLDRGLERVHLGALDRFHELVVAVK